MNLTMAVCANFSPIYPTCTAPFRGTTNEKISALKRTMATGFSELVPEHHRSHPTISRAGRRPPHAGKNAHVAYHYRVHTSVRHSISDFASHVHVIGRWSNETGNVLTALLNCAFGAWLAAEVYFRSGSIAPEDCSRLYFYAFSAASLGLCVAFYHATNSFPPFYDVASAIDLASINLTSLGVSSCRHIRGMGMEGLGSAARAQARESVPAVTTTHFAVFIVMMTAFVTRLAIRRESPLALLAFNFTPVVVLISEYYLVRKDSESPHAWTAAACLTIGVILFVFKVPERFAKSGRFDRFGQSHQWWHLTVAATIALYGADALLCAQQNKARSAVDIGASSR
jgi:predicted membrane channel-forming protein YqfA (hemolysin III family)